MKRIKGVAMRGLVALIVVAGLVGAYKAYQGGKVGFTATSTPESIAAEDKRETRHDGVESVKSRAEFQKRVENEAKKIWLTEERARIVSEYDMKLADLDTQLDETRKVELSFE
jgi:hypothetical protein